MRAFIRRCLAHPRWPYAAGLIGVVLSAPALPTGFIVDDWVHRAVLLRLPGFEAPPLELFSFITGDPGRLEEAKRLAFPWWSAPNLKLAFWRPLSSATHWLDYVLWPDTPWAMHLHSMLWYAACVVAAAFLFRRLLADRLYAGVAAFAYAVSHTHSVPVLFLANRNALVSLFFGISTLLLHDRWRRDGDRRAAAAAPFALLLALLANEGAIAACGYLAAYAVFVDPKQVRLKPDATAGGRLKPGPTSALLALAPYVGVVVAWRIVYSTLGFGAEGSDAYIDPAASPVRFAHAVAGRAPIYLLAQWLIPPSDFFLVAPRLVQRYWTAIAIAFAAILTFALSPLLRRDRIARFWFAGMLMAVIPICATFPMDRMLLYPGLGAAALLSQFIAAVRAKQLVPVTARVRRIGARILFDALIAVQLVVSPLWLPIRIAATAKEVGGMTQAVDRLAADPSLAGKLVVLIDDAMWSSVYFATLRALKGLPMPEQFLVLAPAETRFDTIVVHRPAADTLELQVDGNYRWFLERDSSQPFKAGDVVEIDRVKIRVLQVSPGGQPTRMSFQFDTPLDDPSIAWFARIEPMTHAFVTKGTYPPWRPPAIGETVSVR
jgi:hypothetical protein